LTVCLRFKFLGLTYFFFFSRAKQVLNNARKKLPTELKIWITAAQLEESHGNSERAEKVMTRAISDLKQHGVVFGRDKWLEEAHACEREGKSSVVGGWLVWWLVCGCCFLSRGVRSFCFLWLI
jgi:hypothetical protein